MPNSWNLSHSSLVSRWHCIGNKSSQLHEPTIFGDGCKLWFQLITFIFLVMIRAVLTFRFTFAGSGDKRSSSVLLGLCGEALPLLLLELLLLLWLLLLPLSLLWFIRCLYKLLWPWCVCCWGLCRVRRMAEADSESLQSTTSTSPSSSASGNRSSESGPVEEI